MIVSKTSTYALRALTYVARRESGQVAGVREVSRRTGLPANYIAKVFQGLTKAGILVSRRGMNGGYRFRQDPSSVKLLDVIKATDNLRGSPLFGCLLGLKKCSDENPCALHPFWRESRNRLIKIMETTSIKDAYKSLDAKFFVGKRKSVLSKCIQKAFRPSTLK